jgi:hypothetical protein
VKSDALVQVVVFCALLVGGLYLVIWSADGWEDYVVLGVIVMMSFAIAIAVNRRRYTTKRRTFVKRYEPPKR